MVQYFLYYCYKLKPLPFFEDYQQWQKMHEDQCSFSEKTKKKICYITTES